MTIDRRSFRYGIVTGVALIVGALIGVVLTVQLDWIAPANSESAVNRNGTPLPVVAAPNFPEVVRRAMPAVVNISTTRVVETNGSPLSPLMEDPFFRHFFGDQFPQQGPQKRRENALGSGVIVDTRGYIITNNHVVAKADEIKVLLSDKREFIGKVVGTDPKTDLAVIKINGANLPTIPWGDSDKLEIGGYVLAIGNPFGLNQTVTMGIVSAKGRANVGIADYEDFIQTDAAINPGNSGGALVNAGGELVGVNTAIFSRSGGYMGIGFAVPANMVRAVMDSLIASGKVTRGWLGVSIQDVTPELAQQFGLKRSEGALVSETIPGTPADKAGLRGGDVIIEFDGKAVEDPAGLRNVVAATPVGKTVTIKVMRNRKTVALRTEIVEQPQNLAQTDEAMRNGGEGTALAGLELRDLTPEISRQLNLPAGTAGVVITEVDVGTPAEKAGLQPGDVVLEINRTRVASVDDFRREAAKLGKKDTALLLVNRRGSRRFVPVAP
jgi:serine protease Do